MPIEPRLLGNDGISRGGISFGSPNGQQGAYYKVPRLGGTTLASLRPFQTIRKGLISFLFLMSISDHLNISPVYICEDPVISV